MNSVDTLLSALTLLVAGIAAGIAVAQLRAGHRDAHASRVADLAWQIYQAYEDQKIRNARKAIEVVSNRSPIPQSGKEYGKMYILETTPLRRQLTEEIGEQPNAAVRRMLRFYHQIGILIWLPVNMVSLSPVIGIRTIGRDQPATKKVLIVLSMPMP